MSTRQLKQQLRNYRLTGLFKKADDLSSDTSFEQSFANLVFAVQNDTNPQLMQHTLGFQLLEKDEDESRAIGIVGLQLGDSIVFAPYFFRDGELYGDELLWLADSDLFVPKTSNWINYLVNKKTSDLGVGVSMQDARKWVQQPDLRFLKKYSIPVHSWALNPLPKFLTAIDEEGRDLPGLETFVKESQLSNALLEVTKKYPIILKMTERIYGPTTRKIYKYAQAIVKEANSVLANIKFRKAATVNHSPVMIFDEKDLEHPALTVADRQEILRQGFCIKDTRKQFCKVAELKTVVRKITSGLTTPRQSCVGKVLLRDGEYAEAVFIPRPKQTRQIIILLKPLKVVSNTRCTYKGKGAEYYPFDFEFSPLFEEQSICYDKEEIWDKLKSKLSHTFSGRTSKGGNEVVCITSDLQCFVGFPEDSKSIAVYDACGIRTITVSDVEDITVAGDTLLVPKSKILFYTDRIEDDYSKVLGGTDTLIEILINNKPINYEIVSISSKENLVRVNDKEMPTKEAAWLLMTKYGMSKQAATEIITKKHTTATPYVIIKSAQLPHEGVVTAPAFPTTPTMTDPILGSTMTATPAFEMVVKIPGLNQLAPPKPPMNAPLNPQIVAVVQQAAQTGQKDIFDTAVLQVLLEATDDRDIIDRYLPRFIVGVDAIGRLLFNLYWHYDHFKERLGSNDTERLQNNLRNMFKQLGETVLTLKEKNVSRVSALTPDLLEMVSSMD